MHFTECGQLYFLLNFNENENQSLSDWYAVTNVGKLFIVISYVTTW